MCILGSGSTPAPLGTSWYVLVTYTFEGGSGPMSRHPGFPLSMGEDDPGEVGGVLMLLEVEVRLSVMPDTSVSKSDDNKIFESLPCAWLGRT
jgi:hypothetical protein